MVKINKNLLKQNISSAIESNSSIVKKAMIIAEESMKENLDKYISEIDSHPVSREISNGPNSENLSRTLDGRGNLFSFIGFNTEDEPIDKIKSIIKENTFLKFKNFKNISFNFTVFSPDPAEIHEKTPMPFENGKSWVKGIERGISGFSNYLYGLIFPQSRSGRAIQTENKVRKSNFKPTSYFSKLYLDFIKGFSK